MILVRHVYDQSTAKLSTIGGTAVRDPTSLLFVYIGSLDLFFAYVIGHRKVMHAATRIKNPLIHVVTFEDVEHITQRK